MPKRSGTKSSNRFDEEERAKDSLLHWKNTPTSLSIVSVLTCFHCGRANIYLNPYLCASLNFSFDLARCADSTKCNPANCFSQPNRWQIATFCNVVHCFFHGFKYNNEYGRNTLVCCFVLVFLFHLIQYFVKASSISVLSHSLFSNQFRICTNGVNITTTVRWPPHIFPHNNHHKIISTTHTQLDLSLCKCLIDVELIAFFLLIIFHFLPLFIPPYSKYVRIFFCTISSQYLPNSATLLCQEWFNCVLSSHVALFSFFQTNYTHRRN